MTRTVPALLVLVGACLAACSRSEPPAPPQPAAAASDDRVKNADQLMAPARQGAQTLNAADKLDDVYKAQKEATDKQVEEQTK